MCSIAAAAGFGSAAMGMTQNLVAYQGQKQTSQAVRQSAIDSYNTQSNDLTRRAIQEEDAASQRISAQNVEEARLRAGAEVATAEAGVSGASLDNVLADISRTAAVNRETLRQNYDMTAAQLQSEKRGAASQAISRINSAPKPSKLGLLAGLGSSAIDGYATYKKFMD